MNIDQLEQRRYLTKWAKPPVNRDLVTEVEYEYFELLILELSPDRQYVRVLWDTKPDGQPEQEWLPSQDVAEAILIELVPLGPAVIVPPPTTIRPRMPGMPGGYPY